MKFRAIIKFVLLFPLFFGTGCEEVFINPTFTIGTASEFKANRLYASSDGMYAFEITEINDSRCPDGAECIWAGEVHLKGKWIENKDTTDIEIHSLLKEQDKQPDGFTIQIQDAKPYPKVGVETTQGDLVLTILIQKN